MSIAPSSTFLERFTMGDHYRMRQRSRVVRRIYDVSMRRSITVLLALATLSCGVVPCTVQARRAPVHSATTCDLRKDGRKLGTTYVTSLKADHVSCSKAKKVVKAFNGCRRKHGVKGRCASRVVGYRCAEQRGASIPTQYSSKVTCKAEQRSVHFSYTQYT
jgi:hypothetical protein